MSQLNLGTASASDLKAKVPGVGEKLASQLIMLRESQHKLTRAMIESATGKELPEEIREMFESGDESPQASGGLGDGIDIGCWRRLLKWRRKVWLGLRKGRV